MLNPSLNQSLISAAKNLQAHPDFLGRCQVDTPTTIVDGVWSMVHEYRDPVGSVFDPGAGDGRFAVHGKFETYTGYELDASKKAIAELPGNAQIINACAFTATDKFDLCIGNPPYVRHHDIDDTWQQAVVEIVESTTNKRVNRLGNAYLYFLWQGLLRTKSDGLVAMIVPYEWVSRPSAAAIRSYIKENKWNVDVYRFDEDIFPRVMTTACLAIIDKAETKGLWRYFSTDSAFRIKHALDPHGSDMRLLSYERTRANVYAKRGLSPGNQKVFLLTEGERVHFGLEPGTDVVPAVNSLRTIADSLTALNSRAFESNIVDAGRRCWLIKPYPKVTKRLQEYLEQVPRAERDNWTCNRRDDWWAYEEEKPPIAIFSAGFRERGPRFLENQVKAIAVGGVCGIHARKRTAIRPILAELRQLDFESRVVHHSNSFKKVEIGQMNAALSEIL